MGSNNSKIVKKIFGSSSSNKELKKKQHYIPNQGNTDYFETDPILAKIPLHLGPIVMYRQGSMFFDEDGDLAHEFYVEVKEGRKSKMKRVYNNLRPQGTVKLPYPRLHNDCSVLLYVM